MDINDIKQRFGLVGTDGKMDRAIDTALQVAPTQLSVLIIGESGSGKEVFPRIIHAFSRRKHAPYVAVNCGAIPEGTIDSELFGHEKGSFTGATGERKGYFEEANEGTVFLDEIGELPMATQSKLLRVLEKGEYMRVGSSIVRMTNVRIVAATNVDLEAAIRKGTFREDLFYRLNGVMLRIPPLRERKEDIALLFYRFTRDFAEQNDILPVRLTKDALEMLGQYSWPGNVRQLKNVANQVTALASSREVDAEEMNRFMPKPTVIEHQPLIGSMLPQIDGEAQQTFNSEREILYKILFDLRNDVQDLKKLVMEMANNGCVGSDYAPILQRLYQRDADEMMTQMPNFSYETEPEAEHKEEHHEVHKSKLATDEDGEQMLHVGSVRDIADVQDAVVEDSREQYSIQKKEYEMILRALARNMGKRKQAAKELGISERTLYRKIAEYKLGV